MQPALAGHDWRISEIGGDPRCIERGGHDDDLEIGAHSLLQQTHHAKSQVAVQAALVKLVKDDDGGRFQKRVVVKITQQDAGRDDGDAQFVDQFVCSKRTW